MKEPIIISLGGSLIIPKSTGQINVSYLSSLKALLESHISQGKRFFIIAGGGKTARDYQQAGSTVTDLENTDLDWLGIHATRLNAQLIRYILKDYSYPEVITNPTLDHEESEEFSVVVAAGWHPGNSTDYIAVKLAEKHGIQKVINLSNIDYVYTKDPNKYDDAEKIESISWADFRTMVGDSWDPGASAPFDPIASKEADQLQLEVAILNGENIENLDAYISGEEFQGTIIS